jgi:chromosome partitioning protein
VSTLCITNQKGGVGKTTTAISLGAALAQAGSRVLIVDLDPQGNATSGLGVRRGELERGIYGVLLEDQPIEAAAMRTSVDGLDLLPSTQEMAGAEVELVPALAREYRLRSALENARYDIVLVDCPPSLGLLTINALTAADAVLVPVQCEYYALEGLAQLMSTIDAVKRRLNPALEVLAIILTMADARNRLSMQVIEEVHRHFPELVARVRIPRTVRLAEAPSHGLPIATYDAQSRGAQAYADLAQELSARLAGRSPIALGATS